MNRARETVHEAWILAVDSLRQQTLRSTLAILGVVIGIVTVVLVASVLANVRNQVALLFRELGTDNIFAFHLTGDPYVTPSEREARTSRSRRWPGTDRRRQTTSPPGRCQ